MSEDEIHFDDDEDKDIIPPDGEEETTLAYGYYTQLTTHKEHFSSMQNRYRALTSTWVLAGFFGMGNILSGHDNICLPFSSLFGILVLCFSVAFGVTLLWFLDIVLYQRLWMGTVVELAKLENTHDWLPKCNLNTLIMKRSKKFRFTQSTFYIAINWIFVIISAAFWIPTLNNTLQVIGLLLALLGALWIIAKIMNRKSGEFDNITLHSFQ